ncbi:MAG: histidine phosphatase family protein [Oscillospiraceae bacterium]|nr:histidine phosphatase family protein [Oscillospiraceae bacterium]
MRIIFVRHGEPDYENNTLTEKGFREAEFLKDRIAKWEVDDFYTSPLERAYLTGKPALDLLNRKAEVLEWMKEFHFMLRDPITDEIHAPWDFYPEFWTTQDLLYDRDEWFHHKMFDAIPEYAQAVYRLRSGMDALLKKYGFERTGRFYRFSEDLPLEEAEKTIVIFGHLGSDLEAIGYLLGISPLVLQQTVFLPACSVTVLNTEMRINRAAMFRAQCFGDVTHLIEAGEQLSRMGGFSEILDN